MVRKTAAIAFVLLLGVGLGYGASSLGLRIPSTGAAVQERAAITHVLIVVKENHTYDNYFRSLEDDGPALPHCASRLTQARCQYTEEDLPGYYQLVRHFGSADRYFTETPGPSWPNQMMMVAAQSPLPNDPSVKWTCPVTCFDFPTIADSLDSAGVSWRNYGEDIFDPFRAVRNLASDDNHNVPASRLFEDLATGSLPQVAWVRPSWGDSEHPGYDVRRGEQWTVAVVDSVMRSRYWNSTAILVTWDDAGLVADHIAPPTVESDSTGHRIRYGPRVPLIVVSAYTQPGYVSHTVLSHVSTLKFIESLFQVPALNERDGGASGLSEFFDLSRPPRPPVLASD